jgi:hypothetical protein
VDKGVFLSAGEHKKKMLGLFSHGESGKVILIQGQDQKEVSALVSVLSHSSFIMKDFKLLTGICCMHKTSSALTREYEKWSGQAS